MTSIMEYLPSWPWFVRYQNDVIKRWPQAGQAIVLTFFLSVIQIDTNLFHLQKFSEGSSIVGCVPNEDKSVYRRVQDASGDLVVQR